MLDPLLSQLRWLWPIDSSIRFEIKSLAKVHFFRISLDDNYWFIIYSALMIFHRNTCNSFRVNCHINFQKKWKLRDLFQKSNQRCDLYKVTDFYTVNCNAICNDPIIIIIIIMRDFDSNQMSNVKIQLCEQFSQNLVNFHLSALIIVFFCFQSDSFHILSFGFLLVFCGAHRE